jgi:translation elongation factor EF-G
LVSQVTIGACQTCVAGDEELLRLLASFDNTTSAAVSADQIELQVSEQGAAAPPSSQVAIYSGQLISDVMDALKLSLLSNSLRIVEPLFTCELQCDQSQLGSLYAVLSKRRGEVVKEDIIEGTTIFLLTGETVCSKFLMSVCSAN